MRRVVYMPPWCICLPVHPGICLPIHPLVHSAPAVHGLVYTVCTPAALRPVTEPWALTRDSPWVAALLRAQARRSVTSLILSARRTSVRAG